MLQRENTAPRIIYRTNRAINDDVRRRIEILRAVPAEMEAFLEIISKLRLARQYGNTVNLVKQNRIQASELTPEFRMNKLHEQVRGIVCAILIRRD